MVTGIFRRCRHPYVSFLYFCCTIALSVVIKHPLYLLFSLTAALTMNLLVKNAQALRLFLLMIPFFFALSCLNPLVSHWGNTALFYLFGDSTKPVTLEAICYGLNNALMLVTMVLWFLALSRVITSEKLTFIFAPLFPAVSIMLVMIFRMIPFYRRRARDISEGRRGLGLTREAGVRERLHESMHVLSAVTSSTLEDGRLTASSMESRFWGKNRRTSFLHYRFRAADALLTLSCLFLMAVIILALKNGAGAMQFYPVIDTGRFYGNSWNCICLTATTVQAFLLALFCR